MREREQMSRFANLADKPKVRPKPQPQSAAPRIEDAPAETATNAAPPRSNSRAGRKAIAAYFSREMSLAMHVCARRHGLSLQELMAEAFDDVLRKYGQSPVGDDHDEGRSGKSGFGEGGRKAVRRSPDRRSGSFAPCLGHS
jgi:hypothetical protein